MTDEIRDEAWDQKGQFLLDVSGLGAWSYDLVTGAVRLSAATRQLVGVRRGDMQDLAEALAFFPADSRERLAIALGETAEQGILQDMEERIDSRTHGLIWVRLRWARFERPSGDGHLIVGTLENIDDRKRAEQLAQNEIARRWRTERLLRDVIDAVPAAISVFDRKQRLVMANRGFADLFPGWGQEMREGRTLGEITRAVIDANGMMPGVGADDPEDVKEAFARFMMEQLALPKLERELKLPDGHWAMVRQTLSASGNTVNVATDITIQKRAEAEALRRSEEDHLTGLSSRAVFRERLEKSFRGRRAGDLQALTLVLLDIDHFKAVNDSYGHAAGDIVLKMVGRRILGSIRPQDLLARLSGDELALLLPGMVDPAGIATLMTRIFHAVVQPIALNGIDYTPSISAGAARIMVDGETPDQLMVAADAALYEAKRLGRGRWMLHDRSMAAARSERLMMGEQLRASIHHRTVGIGLQPIVRTGDGAVIGFESLARWENGQVTVAPRDLLPLADDIGMADPLGRLLVDQALRALAKADGAGAHGSRMGINLSVGQFLADDFIGWLGERLVEYRIAPERLQVEISEDVLMDRSIERIAPELERLRRIGAHIALDDFGTGYASLVHLLRFPVTRIKIDGLFIRSIDADKADGGDEGVVARTLIGLAQSMGLEAIAEGVETERQRMFLKAHGCAALQGRLVAPPMPVDEAIAWAKRQMVPISAPAAGAA